MQEPKIFPARNLIELSDLLSWILLKSPKFGNSTGYFSFRSLDYTFRTLTAGLEANRAKLGEERFQQLSEMAKSMRQFFEADPEHDNGLTLEGCKINWEMQEIVKAARRRA